MKVKTMEPLKIVSQVKIEHDGGDVESWSLLEGDKCVNKEVVASGVGLSRLYNLLRWGLCFSVISASSEKDHKSQSLQNYMKGLVKCTISRYPLVGRFNFLESNESWGASVSSVSLRAKLEKAWLFLKPEHIAEKDFLDICVLLADDFEQGAFIFRSETGIGLVVDRNGTKIQTLGKFNISAMTEATEILMSMNAELKSGKEWIELKQLYEKRMRDEKVWEAENSPQGHSLVKNIEEDTDEAWSIYRGCGDRIKVAAHHGVGNFGMMAGMHMGIREGLGLWSGMKNAYLIERKTKKRLAAAREIVMNLGNKQIKVSMSQNGGELESWTYKWLGDECAKFEGRSNIAGSDSVASGVGITRLINALPPNKCFSIISGFTDRVGNIGRNDRLLVNLKNLLHKRFEAYMLLGHWFYSKQLELGKECGGDDSHKAGEEYRGSWEYSWLFCKPDDVGDDVFLHHNAFLTQDYQIISFIFRNSEGNAWVVNGKGEKERELGHLNTTSIVEAMEILMLMKRKDNRLSWDELKKLNEIRINKEDESEEIIEEVAFGLAYYQGCSDSIKVVSRHQSIKEMTDDAALGVVQGIQVWDNIKHDYLKRKLLRKIEKKPRFKGEIIYVEIVEFLSNVRKWKKQLEKAEINIHDPVQRGSHSFFQFIKSNYDKIVLELENHFKGLMVQDIDDIEVDWWEIDAINQQKKNYSSTTNP